MFNQARLKLTGWYLLISMIISLFFSGLIYRTADMELNRFVEAQRTRFERRWEQPPILIDEELINETRQRFVWRLIMLNLGIVGIAGVAGYYLSGKVLYPIKVMVKEQERFVSDAAHELRTPLTAIKTNLEVSLRNPKMSLKDAKSALGLELEQIGKLHKLSEDLLVLAKSKKEINEHINVSEVVAKVEKAILPIASKHKVKIVNTTKKYWLLSNASGLERVLMAIVDNAVKYSHKGGIVRISTKIRQKQLLIMVRDEGGGIKKADLAHIYQRFYRGDKSRNSDGYGLGLAIAKRIAIELGGEIEMSSVEGKGTVATIILPYSARIQPKEE